MKGEPSHKLFLKGVPFGEKEEGLRSWLSLEDSVRVLDLEKVVDRSNSRRGWWVATFESSREATAVRDALNGGIFAGARVTMNYTA